MTLQAITNLAAHQVLKFVINLKVANTLGPEISLALADEVIE